MGSKQITYHAHAIRTILVIPSLHLVRNSRKPIVISTTQLISKQDASVRTPIRARVRPNSGVMEAQAYRTSRILCAPPGCTVESGGHFIGYPFPDTAKVGLACSAVDSAWWDRGIDFVGFGGLGELEDGFNVFAYGRELGVF